MDCVFGDKYCEKKSHFKSDVYSMPEILGRSAILVNPLDKKALINAIHDVLTDPSLKRKLTKNGLRVAKEFTWERCATEHLKIYKESVSC